VVSVDGRVKQRLGIQAGSLREPSWGPFATLPDRMSASSHKSN
jgi:hypothetical protein